MTEPLYAAVYVHDIITVCNNTKGFPSKMHKQLNMDPSAPLEWYLGIKVKQNNDGSIIFSRGLDRGIDNFNWCFNGEARPFIRVVAELEGQKILHFDSY